jgi:DNA replication and repair protein RecF
MYGQKLMEKREIALKQFSDVLCPLYEEVSGIKGVTARYIKSWKDSNVNLLSFLQERRTVDAASGITLAGPHRDRFVFTQHGVEFTGKASTGQRRLLALLLRTAQSTLFSEMTGQKPVLLLDDVLLEIDGEKRRRFLSVLPVHAQAFFTFLPDEPYQRYCKDDTLIYNVNDGILS